MTATELITLLKAERNSIQRIEGWSNLTLEFTMKNGEKITLTQPPKQVTSFKTLPKRVRKFRTVFCESVG